MVRPECLRVRQGSHSLDRRAGGVLREPHIKLSGNNDATIGGVMNIATARQGPRRDNDAVALSAIFERTTSP